MAKRIRAAGGKLAIWEGATDTAPFDTPLSNLSRVKFHSDLNYIQIVSEWNGTVSLPSRSSAEFTGSHKLFDHGVSGYPFILGKITVGGLPVAFTGSVPVQNNQYYGRWLALGANATSVYIHEYGACQGSSSFGTFPAISLPVTVWITNEILE